MSGAPHRRIGRRRATPSSLPVGGWAAMPEPKDPFNDDESPLAGHPDGSSRDVP